MTLFLRSVLVLVLLATGCGIAPQAARAGEIPDALAPWSGWVLHGHEEALCPTDYNNGERVRCRWPARLEIAVSDDGGRFEQRWLTFAPGWVALPGGPEMWPDAVTVDGKPAAVISRNGRPAIEIEPGEHQVAGRFFWRTIPEMIHIPPSLGLLALTVNGRPIAAPLLDERGRLWLQKSDSTAGREDRLQVKIFRLIKDTIPMQVHTVLRLEVSGKSRELTLEKVLLTNAVPMAVTSDLPARIDAAGTLQVQARAGQWDVHLQTRLPGPVHALNLEASPHGDQIWSFEAHHDLRMVEIKGPSAVEPSQTEMPAQWRGLHAYLMKPDTTMTFHEIRRGDTQPAPDQLNLYRNWWLDFDGGGFTVQDNISGVLSRQWRLAMNPPMVLGRVSVDGQDRVITRQADDARAGVELRHGRLVLQADARMPERGGAMPALGWDHDFQKVGGTLHLPPGWKLFTAGGVDQVSDTWLQRWSLLDFFVVLIIALAFLKIRGWPWSLVALAAMVLIYHEPGAPRYVWLHLLAVLALLPLLPAGWFKRLVGLWGLVAGVVLLATALVFMLHQVRWGLYPQLTPHDYGSVPPEIDMAMFEEQIAPSAIPQSAPRKFAKGGAEKLGSVMPDTARQETQQWHQDPDAAIPTGPGLPDWRWRTLSLTWSGPVSRDQQVRFFLLSPFVNLLLALARCVLLIALIAGMLDWRKQWQRLRGRMQATVPVMVCLALLGGFGGGTAKAAQTTFPPADMLDTLRQRLLEKPDCLPNCADLSRMEITATEDTLQVILKVHAARRIAVPLPVDRRSWTPDQILMDNAPMGGLARDDSGRLWGLIPAGMHTLVLQGRTGEEGVIRLPLPLKPHMASFSGEGWQVKGISPDGRTGDSVALTRVQQETDKDTAGRKGGPLPVFLHVTRVLEMGLSWRVHTTVERVTPLGTPVVAGIPLLTNESVTTAGFQVDNGQVLITLPSDKATASYTATLPVSETVALQAPQTVPWTETWVLDAGPIWHCEFEGIAPVHHQDTQGRWRPQWQPWPGERVAIRVTRPKAVDGQLLTIDRARLALTPGHRFGKGELSLRIRTSRGGQHTIELPEKANLQQLTINGKSLPIRQQGRHITFPLQPGDQAVSVQWHQLAPFSAWFKSPQIDVGSHAVNVGISVNLPAKRWVLMAWGPRWGPAVLFWSYLTVIVLAALVLGRVPLTPLKTWQWVLLALGLTQVPAPMALIIVGWLLVLGLRERRDMPSHWLPYNAIQIGLVAWTAAALVCLYFAVKAGLAGRPEMQIAGNGSTHMLLNWTQDHSAGSLPRPWVFSLPSWVFSVLMLAWSLWLAAMLLRWLKWGWSGFSKDGLWRKIVLRKPKTADKQP